MEENDINSIIDIDLYQTLGINENDDNDIIKKQYKKLIFKYHPDKNPGKENEDKFELITLAYTILSSYKYRKIYDKLRNNQTNDFEALKKNEKEKIEIKEDKTYDNLNEELNKKHGYVQTETVFVDKRELGKLLNKKIEDRQVLEQELKNVQKVNIKTHFDSLERKNETTDIIPYNDSLVSLNSTRNYDKLYDTGPSIIERIFELPNIIKYRDDGIKPEERLVKYKLMNSLS